MAKKKAKAEKGDTPREKRQYKKKDNPNKASKQAKSVIRRKVWSSGQEALLVEAVQWAVQTDSRNMWTKIRRDPRYTSVLGQYNGNDMKVKYNALCDYDSSIRFSLFNQGLVIRNNRVFKDAPPSAFYSKKPEPNDPTKNATVVGAAGTFVMPPYVQKGGLRYQTTPYIPNTANSSTTRSTHLPLEQHPLAYSCNLMMPIYGPEYGVVDSDDEDDSVHRAIMSDEAVKEVFTRLSNTGLPPSAPITNPIAQFYEDKVRYVAQLAFDQKVLSDDYAYRVGKAQIEVNRKEECRLTGKEYIPSTTPHTPSPQQLQARNSSPLNTHFNDTYTRLMCDGLEFDVPSNDSYYVDKQQEYRTILSNVACYYYLRRLPLNLAIDCPPIGEVEQSFVGRHMVNSSYFLKSLKTYLANILAMPLWRVFAICRYMQHFKNTTYQRTLLKYVVYDNFTNSSFARHYYGNDIRGGGRHYAMAPESCLSQESMAMLAAQIQHEENNQQPDDGGDMEE